jgi:polyphosphate kinase 2
MLRSILQSQSCRRGPSAHPAPFGLGVIASLVAEHQTPLVRPSGKNGVKLLRRRNFGNVETAGLLSGLNCDRLQTGDIDGGGIRAARKHKAQAPRAKLCRLLDDGLERSAFHHGDNKIQVRRRGLGPNLRLDFEEATAFGNLSDHAPPLTVPPVEQQNRIARLQPHNRQQIPRLIRHRGDHGVSIQSVWNVEADHRLGVTSSIDSANAGPRLMSQHPYKHDLHALQLALVHWQAGAIKTGQKVVVVLEGRDGAGKDGAIKRIIEHLSVRATRVVALPKPTEVERTQWYFQRYVAHLPAAGELVIFNRSWYNRAGVERVMKFATPAEQEAFLRDAPEFERMLVESGVQLVKYWLDISENEQAARLEARMDEPLKALKVSDLDHVAQKKWKAYSKARDEMLTRTHTALCPWTCVRADHKKPARLNVMRHLVGTIAPAEIVDAVGAPDRDILFGFETDALSDGRLAP